MTTNYSLALPAKMGEHSWIRNAAMIIGASCIISLFGPIAIPLPFTPVPIATQGLVILMLAVLMGSNRTSLAVLAFMFQGAAGLPVFSEGHGGMWVLAGPTGGYLFGYLAAAYLTGWIMERSASRTPTRAFFAMAMGNLVIFLFGLPWLAQFVGWQNAFLFGCAPFIAGDLLKLFVGVRTLKALRAFNV